MASLLHRLMDLLTGPWAPRPGAGSGPSRVRRGDRGLVLSEQRVQGRVPPGPPVQEAARCSFDGSTLEGVELVGSCTLSSFCEAELRAPRAAPGSTLSGCRLDGATLLNPALEALEASGCSAREARIQGGALPGMSLCDLVGARLEGVRVRQALGCDLSLATLRGCDLREADLRGSRFRRAELGGTQLEGAQVQDADFTGARGLDAATRAALVAGGARLRGAGWLGLARALGAAAPQTLHRRAAALEALGLGALTLGLGAATWAALTPPPPPEAPPPPPALTRAPTAAERQQTQEALRTLREALVRARDLRAARGAQRAVWPTLVELQDNRFDVDGEGPSEVQEALVPAGLPDNPLTETRGGALMVCEERLDQAALSGVDTDWYYCELTGRLFAAAGASGEATLNW